MPESGLGGHVVRMPVGVVLRRQPGVTRWAKWVWRAVAVLPGAAPANWRELRREGEADSEVVDYHAATVPLELHRAVVEGYRVALSGTPPSIFVILRPGSETRPVEVHGVTASAFEAQDHLDNGEETVERLPMPPELVAWVADFVARHLRDEVFVKRQRRGADESEAMARERARIRAEGDVYRAPTAGRRLPQ